MCCFMRRGKGRDCHPARTFGALARKTSGLDSKAVHPSALRTRQQVAAWGQCLFLGRASGTVRDSRFSGCDGSNAEVGR